MDSVACLKTARRKVFLSVRPHRPPENIARRRDNGSVEMTYVVTELQIMRLEGAYGFFDRFRRVSINIVSSYEGLLLRGLGSGTQTARCAIE